jgi:hypothetical protein
VGLSTVCAWKKDWLTTKTWEWFDIKCSLKKEAMQASMPAIQPASTAVPMEIYLPRRRNIIEIYTVSSNCTDNGRWISYQKKN